MILSLELIFFVNLSIAIGLKILKKKRFVLNHFYRAYSISLLMDAEGITSFTFLRAKLDSAIIFYGLFGQALQ